MKTSYLINLALLVLIIVLYWLNTNQHQQPEAQISTIDSSKITQISISQANNIKAIIEKQGTAWQLTHPISARANPTRIDLLLSILSSASDKSMDIASPDKLKQFGITDASLHMTFNQQYEFIFGTTEKMSRQRYVFFHNRLYLVPDRIVPLLNASSYSFIDNRVLPPGQSITKLVIPSYRVDQTLSAPTISIENKRGHWQSDHNYSSDQLQKLVEQWQYAYATQVLPLAKIDQNQFSLPVKIWVNKQEYPYEFQLILTPQALYVLDQQQQLAYQFAADSYSQLLFKSDIN